MGIFNWFNSQQRLITRKEKLGERFTSDLTTRKFTTKYLQELNPQRDFSQIEYIYQIGWCGGKQEYLEKIIEYIDNHAFPKISDLRGIEYIEDAFGPDPVGDYMKIYIIKIKHGQTFIQLIKGSFDKDGQEKGILFERSIEPIDIERIGKRKLIYPI